MTRACLLTGIVAIASALCPSFVGADEAALEKGEITVETRAVEGSSLPQVVVRGVVDAPPSRVWAIVSDCDAYEARLPRIRAGRVVERSGGNVVCEITVALPFPLSDMTARTRAKHVEGPPTWSRTWTLIEGDYEKNDGSWVLEPFGEDGERTLVTYTVHAIPKSAVPERVQRRAQERSMPGVIERLREETM